MSKLPEFAGLKKTGLDTASFTKNLDADELVEKYLENLKPLFIHHGNAYSAGEPLNHNGPTDTSYETDICKSTSSDSSDGSYTITLETIEYVPNTVVEDALDRLVEAAQNDTFTDSFNKWTGQQENLYYVNSLYLGIFRKRLQNLARKRSETTMYPSTPSIYGKFPILAGRFRLNHGFQSIGSRLRC